MDSILSQRRGCLGPRDIFPPSTSLPSEASQRTLPTPYHRYPPGSVVITPWASRAAHCRIPVAASWSLRISESGRKNPRVPISGRAPLLSSPGTRSTSKEIRMDVQNGKIASKVRAVFFDLDDTLVLTHEADAVGHSAALSLLDVDHPHVDKFAVRREFWDTLMLEPWDPEHKVDVTEWRARLWGRALEMQGVDDIELARNMQSCFDKERMQAFRWTASVELLVKSLHWNGVKVGVITNGHSKVQRDKLRACNAGALFDIILVGGEEPHQKPHPDIFLKACHLAACKPCEAIMVGDTLDTDIKGARSAGFLSTVWVNVHKKEIRPDASKPDHEIATFAQLRQVLQQLGVALDASK